MDKRFTFAFALALATVQSFGAVYYVATDGSDNNAGTKAKPFASLNKANKVVAAGDTVWIRGGIYDLNDTVYVPRYKMTAAIHLTASGESDDNRIHYFAYPGERPIFDATNLPVGIAYDHDGSIDSILYTSPIVVEAKRPQGLPRPQRPPLRKADPLSRDVLAVLFVTTCESLIRLFHLYLEKASLDYRKHKISWKNAQILLTFALK